MEDFKKMFDEEMQKFDDKMSTAKEWLTPKEYFLLLRGLSNQTWWFNGEYHK